jgi:transposase
LSVAEQRYQAVLAVIAEGRTVTEVAAQWKVSRQTLHAWLARYEAEGLEGLADRSRRPVGCPHQMPAALEARVLEMRRAHPFWGPRRILAELRRARVDPLPSESAVYRCLVRPWRSGSAPPVQRSTQRPRSMPVLTLPATVDELWMVGYLLVVGVRRSPAATS